MHIIASGDRISAALAPEAEFMLLQDSTLIVIRIGGRVFSDRVQHEHDAGESWLLIREETTSVSPL